MRITIIKDSILLKDYLSQQAKSCCVLDFNKIFAPDELSPHSVVHLKSPPSQTTLDEYIEIISDLGDINHFSIPWLCHPISEKNDLLPDNLFNQVIDFLRFHLFITDCKDDEIIVLTQKTALIKNIIDFSKSRIISCSTIGPSYTKNKTFLRNLRTHISFLLTRLHYSRNSHFLLKNIDNQKQYTVIRTWFDHRSIPLINSNCDIYFGSLPGWLKKKGENLLYFGGVTSADPDNTFNTIINHHPVNPVLLDFALLSWIDYVKAFFFKHTLKYNIRLPAPINLLDANVTAVFNNYFRDHLDDHFISKSYLTYLSVKKLFKTFQIKHFYNLYENYSWEKLTTRALRENNKNNIITAFQHAQVSQNSTKFFLGKKESVQTPLPDKIITPGETTRDFLINNKNYPSDKTVAGCALRQNHQKIGDMIERKDTKRILVLLWTFESSIKVLKLLSENKTLSDRYKIIINPHPTEPFAKLKPHLGLNYNNCFKISDSSLSNDLQQADIAIYHGTTSCLDALSSGLPVINLELDKFISPDPLFNFKNFKWTARSSDELLEKIEAIYHINDSEYYTGQAKGFDFVNKYFHPVTEESLQVFLANPA